MLKKFFRNRRLKKDRSDVPTGFVPLRKIGSAIVIIDAAEPDQSLCRQKVDSFFSQHRISSTVLYVDFRKLNKNVRPVTDKAATIFRKDLNWFGRPDLKKAASVTGKPADLFICLADDSSYCTEYLSKSARAKFKIGRKPFEGDPYNLIVAESLSDDIPSPDTSGQPHSEDRAAATPENGTTRKDNIETKIFCTIADLLGKIE